MCVRERVSKDVHSNLLLKASYWKVLFNSPTSFGMTTGAFPVIRKTDGKVFSFNKVGRQKVDGNAFFRHKMTNTISSI